MKSTILYITFWAFTVSAYAQENDRSITNDGEAKELLDNVSTEYQSFESVKLNFTLQITDDESVNEKSSGQVYLEGEKYRVNTSDMEIICDNIKRWTILKEDEQVQVNFYEPDPESIESPSQLFTIYKKDFYYQMIADSEEEGKKLKRVELIPKDLEESQYRKLHLYIDQKKNLIRKAVIFNKDGLKYIWTIRKFDTNVNFDPKDFTFDPAQYPDYVVEDFTED